MSRRSTRKQVSVEPNGRAGMSVAYTRLVSAVLFPLHELLKGHSTLTVRRQLEKTQWWTPDRLQQLQLDRLQAMVRSTYQRVPYYRDLMRARGFGPQDIQTLDDLRRFPPLTKATVSANREALKAAGARDLVRLNTGGSSGEPLVFYVGKQRISHDVAAKWRATRWWGLDIGDREIVVWGSPIELAAQDRVRAIRDWVLRTRLMPAFEMSERNLDRFVAEIRDFRPRMLFGYPSALSLIADHARRTGTEMDDVGIRVVFVTAERLYEEQRTTMEAVFGCPVANGYGGRDAGFIAHACPEGRLHVTAEDIIVETVDRDGVSVPPGDPGEILVTHLATPHYPFIRYRTGDVGVLDAEDCPCGRRLPILSEIQGRTTDFVVARDGTIMHGLALIYVVREIPGVNQFRIIQEDRDYTRVQLVPGPEFDSKSLLTIEKGIKERLGSSVKVDLEPVTRIPAEASGKHRYVVSHVSP